MTKPFTRTPIAERTHQALDQLSQTANVAVGKARAVADQTSDRVRQSPLKAVMLAAATGAVVVTVARMLRNRHH